jgi:uncharacterized protein YcbK (DUF882 family)
MSTRRELIRFGLAAGAAALVPAQMGWASPPPAPLPEVLLNPTPLAAPTVPTVTEAVAKVLAVQNLHTGEKIEACFWEDGKYVPDACAALNKVLRDHRTGDVHMMDPGLYEILTGIAARMEKRPNFQIISGYRSPRSNAMLQKTGGGGVATRSLHMDGMAMDVRLPGAQLSMVRKAALDMKKGGVGYYPTSDFVHVDTGRVRQWAGS